MNLSPIGGIDVAAELPVGEVEFDYFTKFCLLPLLVTSLHSITQFCSSYPPWLGYLITVVSIISILYCLVRL